LIWVAFGWFDASGPSVLPDGDGVAERSTLIAVHGGPGLDHINMKPTLAPLADHAQIIFYDPARTRPQRPQHGGVLEPAHLGR